MWWANRDTKKVPFSCRNSAGKRDEEDDFSVVPLFLGAKSAPALSHLCNNVLLCNGRIPSMLTLPIIQQFCTAARGGGILLFFDCLTPTDSSLQRTNCIFFPVNAFFLIRTANQIPLSFLYFIEFFRICQVFFWFSLIFFCPVEFVAEIGANHTLFLYKL